MVYTSTSVRVSRFAQGQSIPDSLAGGLLGAGAIAPLGNGGEILPSVGIPGVSPFPGFGGFGGGPFGGGPFGGPGIPLPGPGPGGPNGHIVRVSVPKPVNPGMSINMIMWFATAIGPGQYAMKVTIPSIGYDHTTPYVPGGGPPQVLLVQNTFQLPADTAPGDLQGNIALLRTDALGSVITDDQEAFTLTVEITPTQPDGCPTGATKDAGGVCHCTDPTKEIVGNACVAICPSGQHRDSSGHCVPDSTTGTCPTGQHMDTDGHCVPDVTPCPTGTHRGDTGSCVPDASGGGDGDHDGDHGGDHDGDHDGGGSGGPPSGDCFTFNGKQYCKSTTPKYGCVRIMGSWYCPPGTTTGHGGTGHKHNRHCFKHNNIRYCKVTTPPTGATNCITVRGMTWCPSPAGDHDGDGHHDHNCPPGQRYNNCVHGCVPAASTIADCPPDDHDDGNDHHSGDHDDNEDGDFDHGDIVVGDHTGMPGHLPPNGNPGPFPPNVGGGTVIGTPGGIGLPGQAGGIGTAGGTNVQAIIQQTEGYVNSIVAQLHQRGLPLQTIQSYTNNLRANIYNSVRQQLQSAGIRPPF